VGGARETNRWRKGETRPCLFYETFLLLFLVMVEREGTPHHEHAASSLSSESISTASGASATAAAPRSSLFIGCFVYEEVLVLLGGLCVASE
jgi:hypothetical protein